MILDDSNLDGDEDDDDDDEDLLGDDESAEVMTTTSIGGTRRSVYVGSGGLTTVTNPVMAVGIPSIGPDGENIIEYEEGTIGPGGAPVSKHNPLGEEE